MAVNGTKVLIATNGRGELVLGDLSVRNTVRLEAMNRADLFRGRRPRQARAALEATIAAQRA